MEGARAGRTAWLARAVLERALRRRRDTGRLPASGSTPEEDSERLSAAFASVVNLMNQATQECEFEAVRESLSIVSRDRADNFVSEGRCPGVVFILTQEQTSQLTQKYYSFRAACRCKEHEIKHICRYHGRQAGERELETSEEERTEDSVAPSEAQTCQQHTRQVSKDIYIEVSPGIYSVTATSEDMVQQTHVVDVNAGQSIDLTFVL